MTSFESSQPDFDTVVEMLAREATRKIDAVFSQLSSTLHNENQTLQARVGGLQSELKTTQENFENARMWREHVLSGSPVLFQQSGLVYTLKPSGKLKTRTDQLTGEGPETGHDGRFSLKDNNPLENTNFYIHHNHDGESKLKWDVEKANGGEVGSLEWNT